MSLTEGPLDPFLGDPDDPSSLLDEHDPVEPLTDTERREVERDLDELLNFRIALEHQGVEGIAIECGDCGELHYFGWDLMAGNLRALLGEGRTHVHEPPFDPRPDAFVSWDYARGYTDATNAASRRH